MALSPAAIFTQMRTLLLVVVVLLAGARILPGQCCVYSWAANPIPSFPASYTDILNPNSSSPLSDPIVRHLIRTPEAVFANVPVVIRDVAMGVRSGSRTLRYDRITVRIGQTTAPHSSTFSANFTSPLTTVLEAEDHVWSQGFGPCWAPMGLQGTFQFLPGHGDLLVEIVTENAAVLENLSFGETLVSPIDSWLVGGGTASLPTTGVSGADPAMCFFVDKAHAMLLGQGCVGSSGLIPQLGVTGIPTPGAQLSLWLSGAPGNGLALAAYGFDNSPPFPLDLGSLGAPGCRQYSAIGFADVVICDALGVGQQQVAIPSTPVTLGAILYPQFFVLDPAANSLGLTTTNYARLLVGSQ